MSTLTARCPSCGGTLEFKAGSTVVIICPFCRSAVARTDRGLDDLGKVAEIVQSESPLKLGLKGVWQGNRFELTGRVQNRHELGGVWDEWYATFSNGWVGWLAEAQGKFYLTFYQKLPEQTELPSFESLQPGQIVKLPSQKGVLSLVVNEKGVATAIAAEGEIPYKFEPNQKRNFVDLSGENRIFATLDYETSPPMFFWGEEVSLKDLGWENLRPAERKKPTVSATSLNCPNCGGPLSLQVPDATERVTCPYCDSLLDVSEGKLVWLKTLKPSRYEQEFVLSIGSQASFGDLTKGETMKIIGSMVRCTKIEGIYYFWHEYLLYNPKIGFRWLVHSDNHWNFVEPVNAAEVVQKGASLSLRDKSLAGGFVGQAVGRFMTQAVNQVEVNQAELEKALAGKTKTGLENQVLEALKMMKGNLDPITDLVSFRGKDFKIFQDANAVVEYVKGEFYWRVEQGEQVRAVDYVCPPYSLSCEITEKEINWSLGHYLTVEEVEKAFGVKNLPRPRTVGPNQPFTGGFYIKYGFLSLVALVLIAIIMFLITGPSRLVYSEQIILPASTSPNAPPQVVFSQPFELKANQNVQISAQAAVDNSWVEIDVDLVNSANEEVESVSIPVEYYHGVENGESWSEGSQKQDAVISALPAGTYRLRIEATRDTGSTPIPVQLTVRQNTTQFGNFICAFILLAIVPVFTLIRKMSFESRRWSESMFGSEDDDSD